MGLFTFSMFFLSWCHCCKAQSGTIWHQDTLFSNTLPAAFRSTWEHCPANSVGACALACLHQAGCRGFFYNKLAKSCKMTSSMYTFQGNEVSAPGFRYFRTLPTCPNASYVLHEPSWTCFDVRAMVLDWTTARDTCAQLGGRLAVLNTASKADFLIQYLRAGSFTNYYYLGGHRPYHMWNTAFPGGVSDHVWLDGVAVDWASNRAAGLSSVNAGSTNNVVAVENGYIIDHEDNHIHYFVCEFPAF